MSILEGTMLEFPAHIAGYVAMPLASFVMGYRYEGNALVKPMVTMAALGTALAMLNGMTNKATAPAHFLPYAILTGVTCASAVFISNLAKQCMHPTRSR